MSFFEKYLSIWVFLCMIFGVFIGTIFSNFTDFILKFEYANIQIPIVILIWLMIYPMMLKVDFNAIKDVVKNPKGLLITWFINWLIKPFLMFGIAWLFFFVVFSHFIEQNLAKEYLAGAILLGVAPCTAMVFVWSKLTNGNPAYTLVQVATNDLIILIAFVPIVALLLGVGKIAIPYDTLFLSVVLFVLVPLLAGILSRKIIVSKKGELYFNKFISKFNKLTIIALLLTLILIFSYQANTIIKNPLHIAIIAIPLIIQTFLVFFMGYFIAKFYKLSHDIAAPCGMIGASNFFELAVATAISLFGIDSPVALATIVGVLVEVPVMLILVKIANNTKKYFNP